MFVTYPVSFSDIDSMTGEPVFENITYPPYLQQITGRCENIPAGNNCIIYIESHFTFDMSSITTISDSRHLQDLTTLTGYEY